MFWLDLIKAWELASTQMNYKYHDLLLSERGGLVLDQSLFWSFWVVAILCKDLHSVRECMSSVLIYINNILNIFKCGLV